MAFRVLAAITAAATLFGSAPAAEVPPALPTYLHWQPELVRERLAAPPSRPRLFFTAPRLDALRALVAVGDESATLKLALLRRHADQLLATPVLPPPERRGLRILDACREVQSRITTLTLVHRLDGDPAHARRAIDEMLGVASWPDWNPRHFLDTAELTLGMAVGYDSLHARLSAEERALISAAIREKGLRPGLEAHAWVTGTNNWTQVCHGGLVAGALATIEEDPETARTLVERALLHLHRALPAYAPDGAYVEGPSYWAFGTFYQTLFVTLLEDVFGTDFGYAAAPGVSRSAEFVVHALSPLGEYFNFGDCGPADERLPLWWFFERGAEPALLAGPLEALRRRNAEPPSRSLNRMLPFAALRSRALPAADALAPLPLHWHARGESPVFLQRSAWNDPGAWFIGAKGGGAGPSHSHMDGGSFVLEVRGVRWAIDLGRENYAGAPRPGLNLWNFRADSDRWRTFHYGPASHNILRFDERPQNIAPARGLDVVEHDGLRSARLDLASLYAGQVEQVVRTFTLDPAADTLLIEDTWRSGGSPVTAAWQWLTRAEVTLLADTIRLDQDGQSLLLRPSGAPWRAEVAEADALRGEFDPPLPGVRRLRLLIDTPAETETRLQVRIQPLP